MMDLSWFDSSWEKESLKRRKTVGICTPVRQCLSPYRFPPKELTGNKSHTGTPPPIEVPPPPGRTIIEDRSPTKGFLKGKPPGRDWLMSWESITFVSAQIRNSRRPAIVADSAVVDQIAVLMADHPVGLQT